MAEERTIGETSGPSLPLYEDSLVEDAVYAGLGLFLAVFAVALLMIALKSAFTSIWTGALSTRIVDLLDQILPVLLVIELLYTVQVSFRKHGLLAESFLVVALGHHRANSKAAGIG
jgi:hypothetical protein